MEHNDKSTEILSVKGLTKHYGSVTAINNVSFEVLEGQVFGILGPNGSGKTTTLSIITGVVNQNIGSYSWFNKGTHHSLRIKIGSFIESPYFYPYLTLNQNLEMVCKIKGVDTSEINRVLGIVNLLARKHSKYGGLSKGMKQRLGIASAIIGDPKVLVLDEPTNGLDPEGIADIRNIILEQANEKKTVVLASHLLDEVEKVCSHVAVLKNGKLLAHGEVSQLLNQKEKNIISTYQVDELEDVLSKSAMVEEVHRDEKNLIVVLHEGYTSLDLNKLAFDNGIIISEIKIEKPTLEAQFLEIVK